MSTDWREFWETRAGNDLSDFAFDRGATPRAAAVEELANRELIEFIGPRTSDAVLDAGCGSGGTSILLSGHVRRIVAVDFAATAIERAQVRLAAAGARNVRVLRASVAATPFADHSFDRIVCASVLQFVDDDDARRALREFARLLKPTGELILHVKNRSSLYSMTLLFGKRVLSLLGASTRGTYHMRRFRWYTRELCAAGFDVRDYNSFNLLMIDRMPQPILAFLQGLELKQRDRFPFATAFARRHGFDLKLRAAPIVR